MKWRRGGNPTTWVEERDKDLEPFDMLFFPISPWGATWERQPNAIVQGPQTKQQNESMQIQGWNPAFETSHSGEFGLIRTNILSRFGLNLDLF